MSKKLTNQIIDQKLFGRDIVRLDNYIDARTKIRFQCMKDNFIWNATTDSVVRFGSGCPKCSGCFISNEEIDQCIIAKNIIRLDDYIGSKVKIRFKCIKDNFVWEALPYNVMFKTGCPKCANCVELSNDIVDQRLFNRNIVRIGNFVRSDFKIDFKCLECNSIWNATPNSVLNIESGCPYCCVNAPMTNEYIDECLKNRFILRIGDYKGSLIKIKFQCLIDNYVWNAIPNNVINNMTGCPNCSFGKNEKLVAKLLQDNNIVFERHKRIKHINDGRDVLVDFSLYNNNVIIEYNGEQHYNPVRFGGISLEESQEKYKKQQQRDNNLTLYCQENNINLVCIDGRLFYNNKLSQFMVNLIEELKNV